jgi:hypothetical protein
MQIIVTIILIAGAVYLAGGVLFTGIFLFRGLHKVDQATKGATIGFKIIIIPGCIVLWPVLLGKWMAAAKQQ